MKAPVARRDGAAVADRGGAGAVVDDVDALLPGVDRGRAGDGYGAAAPVTAVTPMPRLRIALPDAPMVTPLLTSTVIVEPFAVRGVTRMP